MVGLSRMTAEGWDGADEEKRSRGDSFPVILYARGIGHKTPDIYLPKPVGLGR